MKNRERAVEIIRAYTDECDDDCGRHGSCPRCTGKAREAAQALHKAGCITPDLPKPHTLTPATDPAWAQRHLDEWEWVPDVRFDSATTPFYLTVNNGRTDGGFGLSQEEWLDMQPTQLRDIAAVLLAAADHIEGREIAT